MGRDTGRKDSIMEHMEIETAESAADSLIDWIMENPDELTDIDRTRALDVLYSLRSTIQSKIDDVA